MSPPPLCLSTGQSNRHRPQRAARKGHLDFFVWQGGGRGCGLQPPSGLLLQRRRPGGGTGCVPPGARGIYGVCGRLRWLQRALVPTWCLGAGTRLPLLDGADTRLRVDGQLLTVVRLQSIGHDFNSASIGDRAGNVHVCQPLQHCELLGLPLRGRSWPRRFPAPGLSPPTRRLWRTRPGGRHTGQGQLPQPHRLGAMGNGIRRRRNRATRKCWLGSSNSGARGEHCKCSTCVATCLGVQQGLRCRGKGCKEHLGRALVSGLAGMPLPSADGVAWFRGSVFRMNACHDVLPLAAGQSLWLVGARLRG